MGIVNRSGPHINQRVPQSSWHDPHLPLNGSAQPWILPVMACSSLVHPESYPAVMHINGHCGLVQPDVSPDLVHMNAYSSATLSSLGYTNPWFLCSPGGSYNLAGECPQFPLPGPLSALDPKFVMGIVVQPDMICIQSWHLSAGGGAQCVWEPKQLALTWYSLPPPQCVISHISLANRISNYASTLA